MADKEKLYLNRIQVAKNFYKKEREEKIKYWNEMITGRHFKASIPENDRIFVNYTSSTIRNKLSALYYKNPKILVKSRKKDVLPTDEDPQGISYSQNAKNAEETVNYQFKEYRIKKQIKKALYDWKVAGYGVVFTGWETDFTNKKKTIEGQTGKVAPADQSFKVLPSADKEVDDPDSIDKILQDKPDIRRIKPDKIFFSPDSEDEDHIPYCVIERTLSTAVVAKRYGVKEDDLPVTTYLDDEYRSDVTETTDFKRVRIYDYFDAKNHVTCAAGKDEPLKEGENKYAEIFGADEPLPIAIIVGDEDYSNFYKQSEVDQFADLQNELNDSRAQQVNHRKRFTRKYVYDNIKITEEDIAALRSPEDGALIGVAANGEPLGNFVKAVEDANLTYPFEVDKRIVDDINVITGVMQYQRAGKGEPDTLGQTQIIESHSQTRRDEEQEHVEDFAQTIYRRLLQLDQAFLQDTIPVEVTGDDGVSQWIDIDNSKIAGELTLEVESGSMAKLDDDVLRKQTQDAFNLTYGKPDAMSINKELMIGVLDTLPAMKQVVEKLRTAEAPPPPPPPPPKDTVGSITFNLVDMWPVLTEPERAQIMKQFGVDYQPDQGPPPPQGGLVDPQALGEGIPSQGSINQGTNQL